MRIFTITLLSISMLSACAQAPERATSSEGIDQEKTYSVVKTEAEWKAQLSDQEYYVIRKKGTESPGTSELLDSHDKGVFVCKACENPLFKSESKFESGTGWPSFYSCLEGEVEEDVDATLGMSRTEILCADCGGHLGHVFNDGPKPTGLRYCVNGVSLDFVKEE